MLGGNDADLILTLSIYSSSEESAIFNIIAFNHPHYYKHNF